MIVHIKCWTQFLVCVVLDMCSLLFPAGHELKYLDGPGWVGERGCERSG